MYVVEFLCFIGFLYWTVKTEIENCQELAGILNDVFICIQNSMVKIWLQSIVKVSKSVLNFINQIKYIPFGNIYELMSNLIYCQNYWYDWVMANNNIHLHIHVCTWRYFKCMIHDGPVLHWFSWFSISNQILLVCDTVMDLHY